ncbi:hypothetical protein CHCC20331_2981 [Bacillus paralicheniformis]|uniref:Uncharacterized protein n=1 Tax=Bacillus paralicheniformis TaxID=1648923 RepID=A0A7Z0WU91_9BACI|nr:hypothetical protein B4121_3999 [Bacillus paralicheniformis]TWK33184.1 hypothetical protein CHCC20372_0216 [Bacillus paralicheniformis]TWK87620.1 hypothetical protein CHCC20331_2981 [Bacillus paralicheniformis]
MNGFDGYIVGISREAFCISFKQEYIYNMNGLFFEKEQK